jgi:hypothetical protein
MRRIRSKLTYANVMATLAVFLVLGGGSAVALNGQNTVQSDDLGPGAQVKQADVADDAVNSADVVNQSLTGADIKNRSGVQTCKPSTVRYGPICVHDTSLRLAWRNAALYCADSRMRLPTFGEALQLSLNHDLPGLDDHDAYWTQDDFEGADGHQFARAVYDERGGTLTAEESLLNETICVTEPSA